MDPGGNTWVLSINGVVINGNESTILPLPLGVEVAFGGYPRPGEACTIGPHYAIIKSVTVFSIHCSRTSQALP
ncbi:hypothetical protein [Vulcanisaeta souniana]|nr:hypothetical protein [Vulcanisaeta souniana]